MKKRLNQYKGRLTPEKIAEGMNAAINNANRLVENAFLLLENGEYPIAASVAALSIEESGKMSILRNLSLAQNDKYVVQAWRDYRSHTKKNVAWYLPQMVATGARKLDDFKPLFEKGAEHPYLLDQIKQIGFYTDCLGDAHWSNPTEAIDKQLATSLVKIAQLLASKKEVTPVEIELWIKHIGPVWKESVELMEHGLVQFYREMQDKGLAEEGINEMEKFILHGVGPDEDSQEESPGKEGETYQT